MHIDRHEYNQKAFDVVLYTNMVDRWGGTSTHLSVASLRGPSQSPTLWLLIYDYFRMGAAYKPKSQPKQILRGDFWDAILRHAPPPPAPRKKRERAYISMIRHCLEYSCPVMDPFRQRNIDKLNKIERSPARIVTGNHQKYQVRHIWFKICDQTVVDTSRPLNILEPIPHLEIPFGIKPSQIVIHFRQPPLRLQQSMVSRAVSETSLVSWYRPHPPTWYQR